MRTQLEINQEYTTCVTNFGDQTFRMKAIQKSLDELEKKITELLSEKAAPQQEAPPTGPVCAAGEK